VVGHQPQQPPLAAAGRRASVEPDRTRAEDPPRGAIAYLHPRYWRAWAFIATMKLTAAAPARASLAVGRWAGQVLHVACRRQRRVAETNLELCFPAMRTEQRQDIGKRHFEALGMSFAECARAWFCPAHRIEHQFVVKGSEHLHRALSAGKGVILYTGHFTALELCGRPIKQLVPHFAVMFSRRRNALLDEVQRLGRDRIAHASIPRDNVRMMLRSLSRNAVVWYAPDQFYERGELVPFFGEPALTNVATSRLARLSGASVVPFSYGRLGNEPRYEIRFYPAIEDFPTSDSASDARRLTAALEHIISVHPEQYLWTHKKFKGRAPPFVDPYR
jgi:KDO2-lipid IV(A) lauroyltransferase